MIKEINDLKREKKLLKEELALRMKPNSNGSGKNNMICNFYIKNNNKNKLTDKLI